MKRSFISILCFAFLIILILFSETAAAYAYASLLLCGRTIIPSLFPFFIATKLLSGLDAFGGLRGKTAQAFIIGITAGYPVGASYIADEYNKGSLTEKDADSIAVFCSNSGPAFIIGAVGVGVFHSAFIGIILYAVHILAAALGGVILYKPIESKNAESKAKPKISFAEAFTAAVSGSVGSCLSVCAYVIFFGVFIGILRDSGLFSALTCSASIIFGTELSFMRVLLCGLLEMGNAVGEMSGLSPTPTNLALASFILSWGGVSVILQSLSMLSSIKIRVSRFIVGRLAIAVVSGVIGMCVFVLCL